MSESVQAEYVPSVREDTSIVRVAGDVAVAFEEYQKLQTKLDSAMPDCMMEIRGKNFRKKNYWRAIATAFNLSLELISERESANGDDWGFLVTYRATASNGRYADGDGSCFASEKGQGQDSVHNVRAHASTRAVNRAISNLVGFGEVSAEEMIGEQRPDASPKQRTSAGSSSGGTDFDKPLGFGKHKDKTWREMTEGSIGGERHDYLIWIVGNVDPKKDKYAKEKFDRAQKCLAVIGKRVDKETAAAQEPPEEQQPLPDDGAEGF